MTIAEVSATPQKEMEAAYLEYRRACYNVIYQHALERRFFDQVRDGKTIDEVIEAMGFLPERREGLGFFLRALVRFGALCQEGEGDAARYRTDERLEKEGVHFDLPLLTLAIGASQMEKLIHSRSYAGIIDSFYQELNPVAVDFVDENMELWAEFLNTPFYQYSRDRAVDAITRPGGRVLDLACGPGYGLLRNASKVGAEGLVVGLERSRDFVAEALKQVAEHPNVRVIQGDLEAGFPFLRDGFFDGAMIIGAFHFLRNRNGFFAEAARVLKPGGRLCVGYVYSHNGAYDQELMDLRFYLREPPSVKSSREEMCALARRNGLGAPVEQFSLGCFEWCLFEKRG